MNAMSRFSKFLCPMAGAIAMLVSAVAAAEDTAEVYVNGKRLSPAEIAWLAEYACGPVPAGNYWIDLETGYWGFADSARIMGHLRDRCSQGPPSLSEQGQLFKPGEILGGDSVGNDPIEGSDWGGPRQPAD